MDLTDTRLDLPHRPNDWTLFWWRGITYVGGNLRPIRDRHLDRGIL